MRNVRLCVSVRNPRTFLNENDSLIHRGGEERKEKEGEKDEEGKREEEIMKKHLSDVEVGAALSAMSAQKRWNTAINGFISPFPRVFT